MTVKENTSYGEVIGDVLIRYAIVESLLGRLLVAATDRGVSCVSIGKSAAVLEAALFNENRSARIKRNYIMLNEFITSLLKYLEGKEFQLPLPLDIQVSAFQRKVYEAIRKIPYGQTRTYEEIAGVLNRPNAIRAVARACATNPVALVIPCHRVVRKDGNIAGYRWGIWRKKRLLAREARIKDKMNPREITI